MTSKRFVRPIAAVVAVAGTVLGLFVATSPVSSGADAPAAATTASAPVAVCSTPPPGQFACQAEVLPGSAPANSAATATSRNTNASTNTSTSAPLPAGLGPADIQSAYALASAVKAHAGKGSTVGIVDAFDATTVEADLAVYRSTYGLPACTTANGCFRKVNQEGDAAPLPTADPSWGVEISLDVDAVSSVCPDCHILLVEGDEPLPDDLGAAVDTAVRLGADVVSNSYSASELSVVDGAATGVLPADSAFYNHPGVPILVASGDLGYQLDAPFPADLASVIAVGGTSLSRSDTARGWTETAWGDSTGIDAGGAACSAHIEKPVWQHDTACPGRTVADISADADPETGLAVYDSVPVPSEGILGGWLRIGGTSLATPLVSAMYALAGPAKGITGASGLYAHRDDLNDVVGGLSISIPGSGHECPATSYLCSAVKGYDAPTGLGSPNGLAALRY